MRYLVLATWGTPQSFQALHLPGYCLFRGELDSSLATVQFPANQTVAWLLSVSRQNGQQPLQATVRLAAKRTAAFTGYCLFGGETESSLYRLVSIWRRNGQQPVQATFQFPANRTGSRCPLSRQQPSW
ncbi:hypothetical protein PCASD_21338 [Puccinia coronata f. sp. avenae]|uniref:Uncharacterized protein n=1 Tax=Puccinia coronata f. sp. avenae TaxID=200324 RepID=A0A2N5TVA4_9BASI|nr:hypothetical protein PCASD_21338 [Puccinia coronata f. sp. avenae]